ncbi:MAG TPA: hypothetical protein VI968_04480 [archaeon]|nr:hypothetical protein [archaeon]
MKVSISRCNTCSKVRLVDKVKDKWVCFACKQKIHATTKVKSSPAAMANN